MKLSVPAYPCLPAGRGRQAKGGAKGARSGEEWVAERGVLRGLNGIEFLLFHGFYFDEIRGSGSADGNSGNNDDTISGRSHPQLSWYLS